MMFEWPRRHPLGDRRRSSAGLTPRFGTTSPTRFWWVDSAQFRILVPKGCSTVWWVDWWRSVGQFFGLLNGSSLGYLWWSGTGSDIGELTILGGAVAIYKAHTCHVDGCWRISRHKHTQDGQEYNLCRKHHPNVPDRITADMMTKKDSE